MSDDEGERGGSANSLTPLPLDSEVVPMGLDKGSLWGPWRKIGVVSHPLPSEKIEAKALRPWFPHKGRPAKNEGPSMHG